MKILLNGVFGPKICLRPTNGGLVRERLRGSWGEAT